MKKTMVALAVSCLSYPLLLNAGPDDSSLLMLNDSDFAQEQSEGSAPPAATPAASTTNNDLNTTAQVNTTAAATKALPTLSNKPTTPTVIKATTEVAPANNSLQATAQLLEKSGASLNSETRKPVPAQTSPQPSNKQSEVARPVSSIAQPAPVVAPVAPATPIKASSAQPKLVAPARPKTGSVVTNSTLSAPKPPVVSAPLKQVAPSIPSAPAPTPAPVPKEVAIVRPRAVVHKTKPMTAHKPNRTADHRRAYYHAVNTSQNPHTTQYPWVAIDEMGPELGDGWAFGLQLGNSIGTQKIYGTPIWGDSYSYQTRNVAGPFVGAHIDYGYTWSNQTYLGAELYGNLQDAAASFAVNTIAADQYENTSRSIGNNWGIILKPGYHLSINSLLYGRLGFNTAKIQISQNTSTAPFNKWMTGNDYGFGYRHALTENISLALEYDWIKYNQKILHTMANLNATNQFSQQLYQLSLSYQLESIAIKPVADKKVLHKDGYYMGLSVGRQTQQIKVSTIYDDSPGHSSWTGDGTAERIKLGYDRQLNRWFYLAGEVFAELNQNVGFTEFSRRVSQQQNGYGVSLLPGYILNQANILFTRLGLVNAKFEGTNNNGSASLYHVTKTGYELGVGYETAVADNVGLVAEYDYTIYPSWTGPRNVDSGTNTYHMRNNLISLGLNYHF